jgi:hypothetical protein
MAPHLDLDILPFWIAHYAAFDFDRYAVTLHVCPGNLKQAAQARSLISGAGWECYDITGDFACGALREKALLHIQKSLDPMSILVTADSDEFQDVPPNEYRTLALANDALYGELVDRWDDTLHTARLGVPLHEQYPHEGNIWEQLRGGMPIEPRKIMACKAGMPLLLQGSHDFTPDFKERIRKVETVLKISQGYKILHYTWKSGIIGRMAMKNYIPINHILGFLEMFKVPRSDPLWDEQIQRAQQRQQSFGWLPSKAA